MYFSRETLKSGTHLFLLEEYAVQNGTQFVHKEESNSEVTTCSLRATELYNAGVPEKIIKESTQSGHRSLYRVPSNV